jgi:bifunctional non-homologous end joining protein LigD
VQGDDIRLITRGGHDWTARMPQLRENIDALGWPDGWYDGELVAFDAAGQPDFELLQKCINRQRCHQLVFMVFDCPYLAGFDLRAVPLELRRAYLRNVHPIDTPAVRYSGELVGDPDDILGSVCALGLEGITCKRRGSRYGGRRTETWRKVKCWRTAPFVIVGYAGRRQVRALYLALERDGQLRYAGKVEAGLNAAVCAELGRALPLLHQKHPSCTGKVETYVRWVAPRLVALVQYLELSSSGHVRHASLKGVQLRGDS